MATDHTFANDWLMGLAKEVPEPSGETRRAIWRQVRAECRTLDAVTRKAGPRATAPPGYRLIKI